MMVLCFCFSAKSQPYEETPPGMGAAGPALALSVMWSRTDAVPISDAPLSIYVFYDILVKSEK